MVLLKKKEKKSLISIQVKGTQNRAPMILTKLQK